MLNFFKNIAQGNEKNLKIDGKREKIIIFTLLAVFIIVLCGASWDLFGKKAMTNYLCVSNTTTINKPVDNTSSVQTPLIENNENSTQSGLLKKNKPDLEVKTNQKAESNVSYSSYSTCLENTKDERVAKDCCDCLSGDAALHKACRDATVSYDFSKNTVIKEFNIPSKLGKNGDYSKFTASGNQQQCKQECESSASGLSCGDYQFCRTACNSLSKQ